jgi:L-ascorbate metabolism protein UlaG (beta-lactamase superfamily)
MAPRKKGSDKLVLTRVLSVAAIRELAVLLALFSPSAPAVAEPARANWPGATFKDGQFHNLDGGPERGLADAIKWTWFRKPGKWEQRSHESGRPPPTEVPAGKIRVTWVNHSTALIQADQKNILTDPIWSDRASPVAWVGPERYAPPGLRFEDLPRIDAVLLSHNHYDHTDAPTLQRLNERFAPRVVTGLGNDKVLRREGIRNVRALDWWQSEDLGGGVRVTFVPAQHFSQRGPADRNATLWGGFVIESSGGKVLFAGDTGLGPHFALIREKSGPMTAALLPIGAFRPEWFMGRMHMSPADAVKAHGILESGMSIAIHHSTFRLADDEQDEPLRMLSQELRKAGIPADKFRFPRFGEAFEIP